MGREIKRVALDFDWPLREVWQGFLMPEELGSERPCDPCGGTGESPRARELHALWYGNAPFSPEDRQSTPFTAEHPIVRWRAERNAVSAPDFYGTSEWAIHREAQRLAGHFNNGWLHHLNQDDVDVLVAEGRLKDLTHTWTKGEGWQPKDPQVTPTAAEVNEWSLSGFGHDSINCWIVVRARCEREGEPYQCTECDGQGSFERYEGQRAAAEAWEQEEPPAGEGWQVWETVSEGSPVTPVFASADLLIRHLMTPDQQVTLRKGAMSREEAEAFVGAEWVPSFIGSPATGIVEGAITPSMQRTVDQIDAL